VCSKRFMDSVMHVSWFGSQPKYQHKRASFLISKVIARGMTFSPRPKEEPIFDLTSVQSFLGGIRCASRGAGLYLDINTVLIPKPAAMRARALFRTDQE
jgi:hypothetical protein